MPANTISTKIELTGEREYSESIKNANRNLRALRSELARDTSALGNNASKVDVARIKQKNLTNQLKEQEKIVEKNREKLSRLQKQYGKDSVQVANFRTKLNNSVTEMNRTKNQLDAVTTELKDLDKQADKTGKSIEDKLIKKLNFNQSVEMFKTFSSAASSALQGIADTAISVVSAITQVVTEVAAGADELVTLADVSGLSLSTLSKLSYANAAGFDIDVSAFAGAARKLKTRTDNKAFTEGAFKGLDVVTNADGSTRRATNEETLWAILARASDQYASGNWTKEMDDALQQTLGKSFDEFMPYIKDGGASYRALVQQGEENGQIRTDEELQTLASLDDGVQKIRAAIQSIKQMFVLLFADQFGQIEDGVFELTSAINDYEAALAEGDPDKIDAAKARASGAFAGIWDGVKEIFAEIAEQIKTTLTELANDTYLDENGNEQQTLIGKIASTLLNVYNWFESGGFQDFLTIVKGVFQGIRSVVDALVEFFGLNAGQKQNDKVVGAQSGATYTDWDGNDVTGWVKTMAEQIYDIRSGHGDYASMNWQQRNVLATQKENEVKQQVAWDELGDLFNNVVFASTETNYGEEDLPEGWFSVSDLTAGVASVAEAQRAATEASMSASTTEIANAVGNAMSGFGVYIDGERVATAVGPYLDAGMGGGGYFPFVIYDTP